jgi:hypothetical protein
MKADHYIIYREARQTVAWRGECIVRFSTVQIMSFQWLALDSAMLKTSAVTRL